MFCHQKKNFLMSQKSRIQAFAELGMELKKFTSGSESLFAETLDKAISRTEAVNPWFTRPNTLQALKAISAMLEMKKLQRWISAYEKMLPAVANARRIGVIMAGNIPVVGFHDLLCVLVSGNKILAKLSSSDPFLMPILAEKLKAIESNFSDKIEFVEKLVNPEAVIATGSNNSARYFEYYFRKYPHIIRKNRNSVAVLTGDETHEDLQNLGKDIFSFYGLGCRNVSKLYVPENYDFDNFWKAIYSFSGIINHNKYANNYDYNKAIFLLGQKPFLTNEFLILKEDRPIATPVAVLNFEKLNKKEISKQIEAEKENIQCIVSKAEFIEDKVGFGETQNPELWDYADNVDTMKFLLEQNW